jgi:4,5-DOPA dioxygenase extradiol
MPLVYGLYAPNAPNLIDPDVFGGVGKDTVAALGGLDVPGRIRPDVILVATPHWMSRTFEVQASPHPRQIYDFSGFPRTLYEVRYRPPGDPELARRIVAEGQHRGLPVEATEAHGLDHGAWAPLIHLAPGGSIPVVPLSITFLPPEEHLAWGEAIGAALAKTEKRVAFVSTGSITHRLDRFAMSEAEEWPEGAQIEKEIVDLLLARKYDAVAAFDPDKWQTVAPEGNLAPLFEMVGALGSRFMPRLVHTGQAFGAAGMSTLEFTPE